ncbi:hypothetical protein TNCT_145541 [Trichonephila clavata]|uniref:Uncharacterized protein n=1 Tax=Trichonephila clavata TaxID=2740835 RepID=A0A8X6HIZ7_TRICU|nr:hypothetical protein TNCT_145541 [Trichonephila clavata]
MGSEILVLLNVDFQIICNIPKHLPERSKRLKNSKLPFRERCLGVWNLTPSGRTSLTGSGELNNIKMQSVCVKAFDLTKRTPSAAGREMRPLPTPSTRISPLPHPRKDPEEIEEKG